MLVSPATLSLEYLEIHKETHGKCRKLQEIDIRGKYYELFISCKITIAHNQEPQGRKYRLSMSLTFLQVSKEHFLDFCYVFSMLDTTSDVKNISPH